MQGESAIGKLLLPNSFYKEMNALDIFQTLFHLGRVGRDRGRQDHRMEFCAFDAGRLQQPAVLLTEAVDLALNHAANRRRHLTANFLNRLRKHPSPLVLDNSLPVPQVPHHVHHEQRIPFRALPQQFCK